MLHILIQYRAKRFHLDAGMVYDCIFGCWLEVTSTFEGLDNIFFDKKEVIIYFFKYRKQLQYYIEQIYVGFKDLNKEKEKEFGKTLHQ